MALLATTASAAPGNTKKRKPGKKPKFRTITRTFTNPAPIIIESEGSANPYPSPIQVAGFKDGKVLDVNVTLRGITHTFPRDFDVQLIAPNGRRAIIMSDAGAGFDVNNLTLSLDDQAAASLPFFSPLGSGRFKPTNHANGVDDIFPPPAPEAFTENVKLATFTGMNPNGVWRLFVAQEVGDPGTIAAGWSLRIKARVRK